jgi:hypothetical protein
MRGSLLIVFILLVFVGCNNNSANDESEQDSAKESTNTAGEDNHVMENNVNTEPKKIDKTRDDDRAIDSARWQTMTVDTTAWPAADTLYKK